MPFALSAVRGLILGLLGQTCLIASPQLSLPERADEPMPRLLSQTGAFKDARKLIPADGLRSYELNVSFWSDGALKRRWISVPAGSAIKFAPTCEWTFP